MQLPHPSPSGPLWPVSVKGVVRADDQILLAYNDREEWELLGGRLEPTEEPTDTVVREVAEESGMVVAAGPLLWTWVQPVNQDRTENVLIVSFDCPVAAAVAPVVSDEHRDVRWWARRELPTLALPVGYRTAIDLAYGAH